jgi:Uma2 family endonuclease
MAVGIERERRRFTIEEYERMVETGTSLKYDRTVKLRLYARAGIPEYWIVDANAETLEIYRSPSGEKYADQLRPSRDERVAPLAFPEASIFV